MVSLINIGGLSFDSTVQTRPLDASSSQWLIHLRNVCMASFSLNRLVRALWYTNNQRLGMGNPRYLDSNPSKNVYYLHLNF